MGVKGMGQPVSISIKVGCLVRFRPWYKRLITVDKVPSRLMFLGRRP